MASSLVFVSEADVQDQELKWAHVPNLRTRCELTTCFIVITRPWDHSLDTTYHFVPSLYPIKT